MKWDLEGRTCWFPNCGNKFRVLPKSAQTHCCIPHNPNGPTDFRAAAIEAIHKRRREKGRKRKRLIDRVRQLYEAGLKTADILETLFTEGFRKSRSGYRIDATYLQVLRHKYKIRIPQKSPAR